MERKIGEVFEFEGKKLKVEIANEEDLCEGCLFCDSEDKKCYNPGMEKTLGPCINRDRDDAENVIFKDITNNNEEL